MLPLITNVLPQVTASQATSVAATQTAFAAAQAAAGTQPLTPVAVSAAGAAFPSQLPSRRNETAVRVNPGVAQSDRPAILPDPEFWKVPTRLAGEQIAPLPARQQLIGHIQQAVQYTAQAAGQETPVARQEPSQPSANTRRFNALLAKKPGVGDSSGLDAYTIASQRNIQLSLPSSVEAFA